jgi:hypothetical protein
LPRIITRSRHSEELIWLLPFTAASLMLFLLAEIVGAPHGMSAAAVLEDYGYKALRALPLLLQIALVVLLVRGLFSGSSSPIRAIVAPLRFRFGSPMLIGAALAPLVVIPPMFSGFGVFKMLMPYYFPFAWDDAFAAADRALFLGHQPWVITHALFAHPVFSVAIDGIYTFWVFLLSIAIVGFAVLAPRYDRARFFLAFTAGWILLGVVGAWLTSSAGPCYATLVGASSGPEFEPLMARLRDISTNYRVLGAVEWQDILWQAHDGRRYGFGMGISAMPSLHNAISVLYALALARFGRGYAIAGWIFAGVILVGSVHLGWHYAVDGLVAGAAMLPIWWAAGRYLARAGYETAVAADAAAPADADADPVLA